MEKRNNELEILWSRYVEGKASLEEINQLFESLKDDERLPEHQDAAYRAMQRSAAELPEDSEAQDATWNTLLLQADGLKQSRTPNLSKRRPLWRIEVWAAAVAIVLGIGIYLGLKMDISLNRAPATKELAIVPGNEGAVLTLADGSTLVLDSLAEGTIGQHGGAFLSLAENTLLYDTDTADPKDTVYHTMTTPRGRYFSLTLPDGSRVWLNAASSIRYPTAFVGEERRVDLTGEAYFEVVKNTDMPFRVNLSGKTSVTVLGTRFNVNAYAQQNNIVATLLEGKIRVDEADEQVILHPGQQARVRDKIHVFDGIDVDGTIAWKNGLFNFEGLRLREVMLQLERWYDVQIVYQGDVPDIVFRGKVYRSFSFEDICYMLRKMGVQFTVDKRVMTITGVTGI